MLKIMHFTHGEMMFEVAHIVFDEVLDPSISYFGEIDFHVQSVR